MSLDRSTVRTIAENRIIGFEGNEFQDFCDRLCLHLHPDEYTPVRAAGPNGDMKNDGYCPKTRIFYQAHATRGEKLAKTKKKISSDLDGCLSKHRDVRKWVYLTNDTLPGEIEHFVDQLRPAYPSLEIETWGHKKISDVIMSMDTRHIEAILNMPLNLTPFEVEQQMALYESSIVDTIFRKVIIDIEAGNSYKYDESLHLAEKIKLNFQTEEERKTVTTYFNFAYTKHQLIQLRIQAEAPETQNDLHADIFDNYCKYRQDLSGLSLLNRLIEHYVPTEYSANETYKNLSKAYVLFFFDDCTIFERAAKSGDKC